MYTRQEASLIRQKFWTRFGQYMRPVLSAAGESINWLNYKTGIRHIYFRMDAGTKQASVAIELAHPDPSLQQYYYDKLLACKNILQELTGEEWEWDPEYYDENGNRIIRIGTILKNVNVFREEDWPAIISFLKPRIIALDEFWNLVKDMIV
jgi:hypothetical protein